MASSLKGRQLGPRDKTKKKVSRAGRSSSEIVKFPNGMGVKGANPNDKLSKQQSNKRPAQKPRRR